MLAEVSGYFAIKPSGPWIAGEGNSLCASEGGNRSRSERGDESVTQVALAFG